MKKYLIAVLFVAACASLSFAQQKSGPSSRILLIPLDARPPCLKLTEKMGLIGDAQIVSPPLELLGNFEQPGKSEKINEWILQQDLQSFDAAIIVLDMIAYGGLVASRKFLIESDQALSRIEILRNIRKKAPGIRIYGQSVIMRLAPSADGKNEAYREKLARWAKISPDTQQATSAAVKKLEQDIPAQVLADYKRARQRNYKTNLKAIDYVKDGLIDYLILSQDDASAQGVHLIDRENLIQTRERLKLQDKIAVQPGADEVSMLLLARALNQQHDFKPKIKAFYSSEKLKNSVMPFEDRILSQTVSHHIAAAGSEQVQKEDSADILFYVFASRREPEVAQRFAAEIESKLTAGKRVIVADVDPVGDVQGGDSLFTNALQQRHIFAALSGYASWNTAGNTIGTALPHGVIFTLAESKFLKNKAIANRIWTAQNWFMINRVIDDYYYHNLVRAKANTYLSAGKKLPSATLMSVQDTKKVENYCLNLLQAYMRSFLDTYSVADQKLQKI